MNLVGLGVGLVLGLGIAQIDQGAAQVLGLSLSQASTSSDDEIQFDPISIRIMLVIVFFIIFLLVILIIFIVLCLKRHKRISGSRSENCRVNRPNGNYTRPRRPISRDNEDMSSQPISHESGNSFMNENEDYSRGVNYTCTTLEKASKKSFDPRPHQPDIIEAEIHFVPSYHVYDYAYDHRICGYSNEQVKLQVQCTIPKAPDINYQDPHQSQLQSPLSYHEHQDAQEAKRQVFVNHSVGLFPHQKSPINSPAVNGFLTHGNVKSGHFQDRPTPLARLTPSNSSGSPQHSVRILTLQDISRIKLQSVCLILESTSSSGGVSKNMVHSNSDMSWNSPVVSQLSMRSFTPKSSMEISGENITTPVGRSLLDSANMLAEEIMLPIQRDDSLSSTTEPDDDSFTGSEFGDENLNIAANEVDSYEKLLDPACLAQQVDIVSFPNGDFEDIFPVSFSVQISCEDCPALDFNAPSLQSLDYLLNWSVNFDSLVDVFQDLAKLPDVSALGSHINKQSTPNPCEVYV